MKTLSLLLISSTLVLAGCNEPSASDARLTPASQSQSAQPRPVVKKVCSDCGVISNIQQIKTDGEGTGMGAVSGAAAGGYAGNQFGGGKGKIATTAAGVLAGAAAGHYAEKKIRATTVHRLTIRMDDGNVRTVDIADLNGMTLGTKVKVSGNTVYPA